MADMEQDPVNQESEESPPTGSAGSGREERERDLRRRRGADDRDTMTTEADRTNINADAKARRQDSDDMTSESDPSHIKLWNEMIQACKADENYEKYEPKMAECVKRAREEQGQALWGGPPRAHRHGGCVPPRLFFIDRLARPEAPQNANHYKMTQLHGVVPMDDRERLTFADDADDPAPHVCTTANHYSMTS